MSLSRTDASKFLSYVLRHEPQAIGIELDTEGWTDIDTLIARAAAAGKPLTRALLDEVVSTSEKKRFTVSEDGRRIRAAQGHSSAAVAIAYEPRIPPDVLFHGTATRNLESILAQGLRPGERHHVHLSADTATARAVGMRYGKPVVLRVDARAMHAQGHAFYRADNGVWLVAHVPPAFLAPVDTAG
ncbi:RNA 2'-phosphotransferase [Achromobacter sp. Marseille-Q4962]|uniref:RNA 2'-phosphotransferase n=1 Tax=Achromobacter sp. Marseille-Q4962 TaxID=2942202 RepID=UPI0020746994|nr:RNA 2'-phosphotransferase [Achromobacter sp. Marseille-Q4962]